MSRRGMSGVVAAHSYTIDEETGTPWTNYPILTIRWKAIKEIINTLKAKTPCKDCRVKFPPESMDFDHVRGEKRFQLSNPPAATSAAEISREIRKCEIVCSNCHRVRTVKRAALKRNTRAYYTAIGQ